MITAPAISLRSLAGFDFILAPSGDQEQEGGKDVEMGGWREGEKEGNFRLKKKVEKEVEKKS